MLAVLASSVFRTSIIILQNGNRTSKLYWSSSSRMPWNIVEAVGSVWSFCSKANPDAICDRIDLLKLIEMIYETSCLLCTHHVLSSKWLHFLPWHHHLLGGWLSLKLTSSQQRWWSMSSWACHGLHHKACLSSQSVHHGDVPPWHLLGHIPSLSIHYQCFLVWSWMTAAMLLTLHWSSLHCHLDNTLTVHDVAASTGHSFKFAMQLSSQQQFNACQCHLDTFVIFLKALQKDLTVHLMQKIFMKLTSLSQWPLKIVQWHNHLIHLSFKFKFNVLQGHCPTSSSISCHLNWVSIDGIGFTVAFSLLDHVWSTILEPLASVVDSTVQQWCHHSLSLAAIQFISASSSQSTPLVPSAPRHHHDSDNIHCLGSCSHPVSEPRNLWQPAQPSTMSVIVWITGFSMWLLKNHHVIMVPSLEVHMLKWVKWLACADTASGSSNSWFIMHFCIWIASVPCDLSSHSSVKQHTHEMCSGNALHVTLLHNLMSNPLDTPLSWHPIALWLFEWVSSALTFDVTSHWLQWLSFGQRVPVGWTLNDGSLQKQFARVRNAKFKFEFSPKIVCPDSNFVNLKLSLTKMTGLKNLAWGASKSALQLSVGAASFEIPSWWVTAQLGDTQDQKAVCFTLSLEGINHHWWGLPRMIMAESMSWRKHLHVTPPPPH